MTAAAAGAPAPYLSFVIPVFDEEENLPELLDRLGRVADGLGRPYEIVLVNDGSRDRSLEVLRRAAAERPHLVVVDLNRNYGQHSAVFAGFEVARGEIVVTLDADLQNPPEEIPKLVAKMEEGYDLVGSVRVQREDTAFRRLASRLINWLTVKAAGVRLTDIGCMLRAYRGSIARTLCASQEISTFIPVLAELYAGRVTEIPVAHADRRRGESKYGLWQLVRLQFDLVTSFSVLPLRVTMAIGVATSALSMATAVVLVVGRLVYGHEWAVSGVFTLFAVLFALLGVLLFAIGLLGEYVGRIYMEVRHRPRFIVREVIRSDSASVSEGAARRAAEAAGAGVKAVVFGYHSMGCLGLEALLAHGFEVAAVLTHRDDPGEEVWWESLAEKARARGVRSSSPPAPTTRRSTRWWPRRGRTSSSPSTSAG